MCIDPVTAAAISLATTVASTGLGIASQARQAAAQQAQAAYQAAVARNDRITAERLARDAEARGRLEEDKARLQTRSLIGKQIAALAAQGTDLAGSPADLLGDTAAAGEADALAIRRDAQREAWGFRAKGVALGNEAAAAETRRRNAALDAPGVATSLIGSAGTVADKWYRFRA